MEKSNRKAPIVFYVGLILLCIWFASFHFAGRLYARYSSFASGSDSARVAIIAASITDEPITADDSIVDASRTEDSYQHKITVLNKDENGVVSDVAFQYVIFIALPDDFPANVEITVTDTKEGKIITDGEKTSYRFTSTKTLPAGIYTSQDHTITIQGTDSTVDSIDNAGISVSVRVEQID